MDANPQQAIEHDNFAQIHGYDHPWVPTMPIAGRVPVEHPGYGASFSRTSPYFSGECKEPLCICSETTMLYQIHLDCNVLMREHDELAFRRIIMALYSVGVENGLSRGASTVATLLRCGSGSAVSPPLLNFFYPSQAW